MTLVHSFRNEEMYVQVYDNRDDIPTVVWEKALEQLKTRTLEHYRNFIFIEADVYDLESIFKDFSGQQINGGNIIPKYAFAFEWRDSTLGISRQLILLTLDEFGQIIYFSFPDLSLYSDPRLCSLDEAKSLADSVMHKDYKKITPGGYSLEDYTNNSMLYWSFNYEVPAKRGRIRKLAVNISIVDKGVSIEEFPDGFLQPSDTQYEIVEEIIPILPKDDGVE